MKRRGRWFYGLILIAIALLLILSKLGLKKKNKPPQKQ